jgi:CxxC motif-containing protein (DUF1111 family)
MKSIGLSFALLFFITALFFQCAKKYTPENAVVPYELDEEYSGGRSMTIFDVTQNAFGFSSPEVNGAELDSFLLGNSFFRSNWVIAPATTTARDGLGPFFNSKSCSGCHFLDGRGKPPEFPEEELTGLLFRLSIPGTDINGGPLPTTNYGGQLSNQAIPGVTPEGTVRVEYLTIVGYFEDGTVYSIRKPIYTFQNLQYGSLPSNFKFSPRVAQQIPGLGLLEAVDEATILAFADEFDVNQDGISGRPNYVWDESSQQTKIGRFGWKANQPSLFQQTCGAFLGDIGITSDLFPNENLTVDQQALYSSVPNGGTPELTMKNAGSVTFYCQSLAVPARRNWTDPQVVRGKQLFVDAQCASCHIPKMPTGLHTLPYLSNKTIRPYTDLLLHDMGDGLADDREDFLANGKEWRTPPLWGIGLIQTVNGHTYLLHDGRARNVQEAILWHGGEATASKNMFLQMNAQDRAALLAFIQSL